MIRFTPYTNKRRYCALLTLAGSLYEMQFLF